MRKARPKVEPGEGGYFLRRGVEVRGGREAGINEKIDKHTQAPVKEAIFTCNLLHLVKKCF